MKRIKLQKLGVAAGLAMLALGMSASTLLAQESFSESHLEAAKSVAVETKVLEPFNDILPLLAEQTRTAFIQNDPTRAEEIIEVVQNVALQLAPKRQELNKQVYEAWAQSFSEEELVQLAEFYRTPLGVKLRDSIPEITGKSVNAAREWQDRVGTEMVAIVQEQLSKPASE